MNARECVLAVLDHKEPDRIAFDLGGTTVTGIHVTAYKALRDYLGMPVIEIRVDDLIEQLAVIDPDMAERLGTDCRRVSAGPTSTYERIFRDEGNYTAFSDEWGISWRMPKQGGFSFDTYQHPLAEAKSLDDLRDYA
jgi:uroporphyrinogen decarboxylase